MGQNFNLTRDSQGAISYGLCIVSPKKYNNSFAINDETYIVIESPDDKYVIFLPEFGGSYHVSSDPNPAIPSTPGAQMQEADTVQTPAHISLDNWPYSVTAPTEKRIYIKSLLAQSMTVLVYGRGI